MGVANTLRQFLRDMRTQKLRFTLTLFGIVWGTVAITLLLAFGESMRSQMLINMRGLGENIVICWPSTTSRVWEGLPRGRAIRVTAADIEHVRESVPQLAAITGEYSAWNRGLKVGRTTIVPRLAGVNAEYADMRNIIPQAGGRFLNAIDLAERRRVMFLGNRVAADLFGQADPVGEYLTISGVPFLVIGVMKEKNQDSNYSGPDHNLASIPGPTFRAMLGQEHVNNFVFQVAHASEVDKAKNAVVGTLARIHRFDPEDEQAVQMWDTTENEKFIETFMIAFNAFVAILGALTLVVGGIGVSNIMSVVVEERTKEIGLKMALGAKQRSITNQFLLETMAMTFLGGALGLAIAAGICAAVPAGAVEFIGAPRVSLRSAAIATSLLGIIGFLAGYFPARTAVRLNPVEALRM